MEKFRLKDRILDESQLEYIEKVSKISQKTLAERGRAPRYYSHTYGCQQNENDTERMNGLLEKMGFEAAESKDDADIIIFNTCAVREHAEQKILGNLGALVKNKRENPELKIVLCGCMFQQKHTVEKIKSYRHVDMILGTHALKNFPEHIYRLFSGERKIIDTEETDTLPLENVPVKRENGLKAWVTVMAGCNNFCSYCVVPYVRGREHSRYPDDVLAEVKDLVKSGYKDITLLGQNVNSYCNDLDIDYDFADLLRDVNAIEGEFRIRFMTSHPKDATEKLFDTIAECDKVCNHVHLPFQSGSDRVLSLMNRRYTAEKYLSLIDYAKKKIPGVSFTSDVIVGFPTETEEDFEDTLKLVEKVGFSGLYTFIFSPRKNTPAAEMEGQIPQEVKSERFNRLLALQNENSVKANERHLGKTVEVLCEGYADDGYMTGRTEDNTIVRFRAEDGVIGKFVSVEIDKALNWAVFGRITYKNQKENKNGN